MEDNKKFWQRVAKLYTLMQEKTNKIYYDKLVELSVKYIENKDVLELACGTGQFSFDIAKSAKSLIATDFSKNMIDEALKRNQTNVCFEVADATALKYDNRYFDVVFIANALHIMPNPKKALDEIARVLKDGGLLIAPTFVYENKYNRMRIWILEKFGFKTYHKWKANELIKYVEERGYILIEQELLEANPLPELFVVFRKKNATT